MTNARGDEATLLARRQTTFGTREVDGDGTFRKLPFYSYDVTPTQELTEDEAIQGDAYPGDGVGGLRNLAGSMTVPLGLASIGWHLRAMFGAPVTTNPSAGNYQHIFSAGAQPAVIYSTHAIRHTRVNKNFVQDSLVYTGIDIDAAKKGERARAMFSLVGREEVNPVGPGVDITPGIYTTDPVPVKFLGEVLVDGAVAAAVTRLSFSLKNGAEADQETMNNFATAASVEMGRWDLSGSLDTRFVDNTYYNLADAGTPFDLRLRYNITADTSLLVRMYSVRLERAGIPISNRGVISAPFKFKAMRPSGANFMEFTLKNQTANYFNL